jgi:hypothetical protein
LGEETFHHLNHEHLNHGGFSVAQAAALVWLLANDLLGAAPMLRGSSSAQPFHRLRMELDWTSVSGAGNEAIWALAVDHNQQGGGGEGGNVTGMTFQQLLTERPFSFQHGSSWKQPDEPKGGFVHAWFQGLINCDIDYS